MKLENQKIVMTGGTSGLGTVVANHILNQGGELFLLLRDPSKLDQIENTEKCHAIECDLANLSAVKEAIETIKSKTDKLDVLINNAGMWNFGDKKLSKDNIELTWQVNVLAPFLLMKELSPLLSKGENPIIINTASALHFGEIYWEDPTFIKKKFSGFHAYRQSKLAIILLTIAHAEKTKDKIKVVSNHPGVINTKLARGANWFIKLFFSLFGKAPKKGAETILYLLNNRESVATGKYFADKKEKATSTKQSKDKQSALRLEKMVEEQLEEVG